MQTIISIGTDTKILEGGRVYERVKEYANLVDGKYLCFIFTNNKKFLNFKKNENNFFVTGIYGKNKLLQIFNLFFHIFRLPRDAGQPENSNNKNEKMHGKSQGLSLRFPENSDVIWYPQDAFEIGLVSLLCKYIYNVFRNKKSKLFVQCHTDISHPNFKNSSWRNYLQYLIAKIVFRRVDKIRVVSSRMKKYLVLNLKIPENKILSLPIYFDFKTPTSSPLAGGEEEPQVHQKQFDFLVMSRIEKEKNIETAILAIQEINQERKINGEKEFTLKIVGDGNIGKHLRDKFGASPLPIEEGQGVGLHWLEFAPWTNNPTQEYKNAKYFLLPSLYEGWAMTAIESVLCGTPVIMTDVGCANEVIINFENGIISEGFDVESFKSAINLALKTNFQKENLSKSVLKLNSKQEYLEKLKLFLRD